MDTFLTFGAVIKTLVRLFQNPPPELDSGWLGKVVFFTENSRLSESGLEQLAAELARLTGVESIIPTQSQESVKTHGGPKKPSYLCLEESVSDYVKGLLKQVSTYRGYRFHDEAQSIIRELEEGQPQDLILRDLTQLMCRFIQDYSEEKSQITLRLSNIIKTLMFTEKEFQRLLGQSISYMDGENREFNESLSEHLSQLQGSVQEVQEEEPESATDADNLLTVIAEKIEVLFHSIQEKTNLDEQRLAELNKEKTALESRLDSVRRDYDSFVTQSRKLLKELEDFKSISMKDALTGVYNRRAYDEAVNLSIENFKNNRLETFSLLIFDIDHFRDVNNTYGHQAGDSILSHMGRIITDLLRCDDFIFRYGGDEFIVLLPEAKLADATRVAEKLRRSVASVEFKLSRHSEKTIHVNISMGVTEIRPGDNAISVLARADTALYVSKQNGRNRVTSD